MNKDRRYGNIPIDDGLGPYQRDELGGTARRQPGFADSLFNVMAYQHLVERIRAKVKELHGVANAQGSSKPDEEVASRYRFAASVLSGMLSRATRKLIKERPRTWGAWHDGSPFNLDAAESERRTVAHMLGLDPSQVREVSTTWVGWGGRVWHRWQPVRWRTQSGDVLVGRVVNYEPRRGGGEGILTVRQGGATTPSGDWTVPESHAQPLRRKSLRRFVERYGHAPEEREELLRDQLNKLRFDRPGGLADRIRSGELDDRPGEADESRGPGGGVEPDDPRWAYYRRALRVNRGSDSDKYLNAGFMREAFYYHMREFVECYPLRMEQMTLALDEYAQRYNLDAVADGGGDQIMLERLAESGPTTD